MFVTTFVFVWFSGYISCVSGAVWEYEGAQGPNYWQIFYPACAGVMQSPIGIESIKATYDISLLQFGFKGFDERIRTNMTIKNNGHTVQVDIVDTSLRSYGGGLTGGYKPVQFHFHWGGDNSRGSEHVIDNKHYPMEMHIVHYSEAFQTITDAIDKPDGLMVLGFFFELGQHNAYFEEIFKYLGNVTHKDDTAVIPPVVLLRLIPDNLVHYYRYRGSLTTPPCYESVVWTVFIKPIVISEIQMATFRQKVKGTSITDQADEVLVDNFRPIQQLKGRNVYTSIPNPSSLRQTANNGFIHILPPALILFYLLITFLV